MKRSFSLLWVLFVLLTVIEGCDKKTDLPSYSSGTAPVLISSATTLAPTAADSLKKVLGLSWTNPKHASDSATYKYVIEIDSAGRNFSKAYTHTVTGARVDSFTAKELNTAMLNWGFAFNTAYDVDVRVTSSYGNNNEQLRSNVIRLKMTPYKIPPKVALPVSGHLFIVGDATAGGWANPVPVPSQELTKIDSVTWGGIFTITGGKQYLLLPVNGDWTNKFSVANNTVSGLAAGGDFGYNLSDNFPGPATSGTYKLVVNFQTGKFTMTPYTGPTPNNLFIVGDATAGGWTNPVPVPSQQFTRTTNSVFELTLPLVASKQYLLLPINGDWTNKFSVASNTVSGLAAGGDFGYNLSDNFPGPSIAGNYKIVVNLLTYKFSTTKL
jgi:starch-binding outer membrane protein SusE/F